MNKVNMNELIAAIEDQAVARLKNGVLGNEADYFAGAMVVLEQVLGESNGMIPKWVFGILGGRCIVGERIVEAHGGQMGYVVRAAGNLYIYPTDTGYKKTLSLNSARIFDDGDDAWEFVEQYGLYESHDVDTVAVYQLDGRWYDI